jgi:predicted dehydrogenase
MDIVLWMTGLVPAEAFAWIDNRGAEIDVLTAASIRFANGALCNFSVVGELAYKGMEEGEHIWGDKGYLAITGVGNPTVTLSEPQAGPALKKSVRQIPPEEMGGGAESPDHNFIGAILGRERLEVPAECGLRVIQASQAIWESARTGRPVKVES